VYREAIFYGTAENREKVSLICWLLPYMQRYIYKMHKDTYINFQQNEIMKLSNLQVVVVDKLFHKYVLRGLESSSNKRFKCHCLLQVSINYSILWVYFTLASLMVLFVFSTWASYLFVVNAWCTNLKFCSALCCQCMMYKFKVLLCSIPLPPFYLTCYWFAGKYTIRYTRCWFTFGVFGTF
jgi:hypothetical protein